METSYQLVNNWFNLNRNPDCGSLVHNSPLTHRTFTLTLTLTLNPFKGRDKFTSESGQEIREYSANFTYIIILSDFYFFDGQATPGLAYRWLRHY